ncbi:hypothetical protein [Klebsiella pneumoniae]|uniref:hypothetical protein n=1 Tax=Klebsiella pneumoniae TaxID=573 RepID=UPI001B8B58C8|nr:hypothetical protein [Klebsiella pneumoniae]MBR7436790.1 hypothetical protein [Klebsiella pneumoniae]
MTNHEKKRRTDKNQFSFQFSDIAHCYSVGVTNDIPATKHQWLLQAQTSLGEQKSGTWILLMGLYSQDDNA